MHLHCNYSVCTMLSNLMIFRLCQFNFILTLFQSVRSVLKLLTVSNNFA